MFKYLIEKPDNILLIMMDVHLQYNYCLKTYGTVIHYNSQKIKRVTVQIKFSGCCARIFIIVQYDHVNTIRGV